MEQQMIFPTQVQLSEIKRLYQSGGVASFFDALERTLPQLKGAEYVWNSASDSVIVIDAARAKEQ